MECNANGGFDMNNIGCISCPEGFVVKSENGGAYCQPVV